MNAVNKNGLTPIMYAARAGNGKIVETLLQHGANINARANDGNSALTFAADNGN